MCYVLSIDYNYFLKSKKQINECHVCIYKRACYIRTYDDDNMYIKEYYCGNCLKHTRLRGVDRQIIGWQTLDISMRFQRHK